MEYEAQLAREPAWKNLRGVLAPYGIRTPTSRPSRPYVDLTMAASLFLPLHVINLILLNANDLHLILTTKHLSNISPEAYSLKLTMSRRVVQDKYSECIAAQPVYMLGEVSNHLHIHCIIYIYICFKDLISQWER
jgi:hypothetical protein